MDPPPPPPDPIGIGGNPPPAGNNGGAAAANNVEDHFWLHILYAVLVGIVLKFVMDVGQGILRQRAEGYPWK
jgi:hypothetical protein